jgi:hypothetical protein
VRSSSTSRTRLGGPRSGRSTFGTCAETRAGRTASEYPHALLSNGLGILLARAMKSQAQDLAPNLPISLPVLKASAVERCLPGLLRLETNPPRPSAQHQFLVMSLQLRG